MRQSDIFAGVATRKRTLQIAAGVLLILLFCFSVFWMIVSGRTRRHEDAQAQTTSTDIVVPQAENFVPRRLDGVLVPAGQDSYAPRAIMIDNQVDARPQSGITKASVVVEAPAEGGITRFMALFDATTSVDQVGPIRSARPYFVDLARGWNAAYFHVGGSPDALQYIQTLSNFDNVDEMAHGSTFWRSDRAAPHNVYTSSSLMSQVVQDGGFASSTAKLGWYFQDAAASSSRGSVTSIRVPYGGSYSITWKYDPDRGVYQRMSGKTVMKDADGNALETENVIVMKTDSTILDEKGRLRVRTTGSGDAIMYRDGNRYPVRWSRGPGELIRFENVSGSDFLLTRGRTWMEVVTTDLALGGVDSSVTATSTSTH